MLDKRTNSQVHVLEDVLPSFRYMRQQVHYWWGRENSGVFFQVIKGKGKAVPLQAWSGPEVSKKLRFPDFMTTAQDGGKGVSLTHRPPLPPGNTPGTHFC